MPQTPHVERHLTGSQTIRDIVVGMSEACPTAGAGDLTVSFALAPGLSGAVASIRIVGQSRLDRHESERLPGGKGMPSIMPARRRAKNGKWPPFLRRRSEKSWRSSRLMVSRLWGARP